MKEQSRQAKASPRRPGGSSARLSRQNLPFATFAILAVSAVFLAIRVAYPDGMDSVLALRPHDQRFLQLLTSGFLHFGVAHFLWSAFFLVLFGVAVERAAGPRSVLASYFSAMIVSGITLSILAVGRPLAPAASIASAAVAGLLGAYVYLCWGPGASASSAGEQTRRAPDQLLRIELPIWLALFVAFTLYFALRQIYEGFDLRLAAAHGSGFVSGALSVWILASKKISLTRPNSREQERVLRERLDREIRKEERRGSEAAPLEGSSPAGRGRFAAEAALVLESIDSCDSAKAYERFHDLAAKAGDGCLDQTTEWKLAVLLLDVGRLREAVEVLKHLLRSFPHGKHSVEARLELGILYSREPRMRDSAVEYIQAALAFTTSDIDDTGVEGPRALDAIGRSRARRVLLSLGAEVPSEPEEEPAADDDFAGIGSEPGVSAQPAKSVDLASVFGEADEAPALETPTPYPARAMTPIPNAPEITPLSLEASATGESSDRLAAGKSSRPPQRADELTPVPAEILDELERLTPPTGRQEAAAASSTGSDSSFSPAPDFEALAQEEKKKAEQPHTVKKQEELPSIQLDFPPDETPVSPAQPSFARAPLHVEPLPASDLVRPSERLIPRENELPAVTQAKAATPASARKEPLAPPLRLEDTEAPRGHESVVIPINPPPSPFDTTADFETETRIVNPPPPIVEVAQGPVHGILFANSDDEETQAWKRHYSRDRRPRYRPEFRYSIILAPGAPVLLGEVIDVLQSHLGVGLPSILHSLQRHHGLLAMELSRNEAAGLAMRFVSRHQEVMLVEHDERLAFTEPVDVLRLSLDDRWAGFATAARFMRRNWPDVIGLTSGVIQEGGAARSVINLYCMNPALQLRLWMNTLAPVPLPEPITEGGQPSESRAFHALAMELARRAPHAIRSRSFTRWISGEGGPPPVAFANLIEFDNYSLWYLMAHYARASHFAESMAAAEFSLSESTG